MGFLSKIGHVNFRVADQERSKRFYTEVLGLAVAEEDPEHGGVFLTLGHDFHNFDVSDGRGRMDRSNRPPGFVHVAFQVESIAALREAYVCLQEHGIEIDRAIDHVIQRSLYFRDPDGNGLEIYYEMPNALQVFEGGRGDQDELLPLSELGQPLPDWLLDDSWPTPADIERSITRRDAPAG